MVLSQQNNSKRYLHLMLSIMADNEKRSSEPSGETRVITVYKSFQNAQHKPNIEYWVNDILVQIIKTVALKNYPIRTKIVTDNAKSELLLKHGEDPAFPI